MTEEENSVRYFTLRAHSPFVLFKLLHKKNQTKLNKKEEKQQFELSNYFGDQTTHTSLNTSLSN